MSLSNVCYDLLRCGRVKDPKVGIPTVTFIALSFRHDGGFSFRHLPHILLDTVPIHVLLATCFPASSFIVSYHLRGGPASFSSHYTRSLSLSIPLWFFANNGVPRMWCVPVTPMPVSARLSRVNRILRRHALQLTHHAYHPPTLSLHVHSARVGVPLTRRSKTVDFCVNERSCYTL